MLVVGGLMIAFWDTRGPLPELTCVEQGKPTSGYTGSMLNEGYKDKDCYVTTESVQAYRDWNGPVVGRIVGLATVVVAIVLAVSALFVGRKKASE